MGDVLCVLNRRMLSWNSPRWRQVEHWPTNQDFEVRSRSSIQKPHLNVDRRRVPTHRHQAAKFDLLFRRVRSRFERFMHLRE